MNNYCPLCEKEKETTYEYRDDYICGDCFEGIAERLAYQYQDMEDNIAGGN